MENQLALSIRPYFGRVVVLLFAFLILSPIAEAGDIALSPISYQSSSGSDGGQSVSSLSTADQSGVDDDWDRYVEFYTDGVLYSGTRKYFVPENVDLTTLTQITLRTNYRGPDRAYQTWTWKLYDWTNRRWVVLGNNADAPAWQWHSLSFTIPESSSEDWLRFISPTREMLVQFDSDNALDNCDLDYETILLNADYMDVPEPEEVGYWVPPVAASWQIQFTGPIDTSLDVDIYDLDLFDTEASVIADLKSRGKNAICYINAGTWENWRPDASRFPRSVKGRGNGWPGEKWLDIRRMDILGPLMEARLDLCKAKGFVAVDPDNINGYANRTGFPLTYEDQIRYNTFLANAAHARGLSIGLKNDLEQIPDLIRVFDWALNESCFVYDECHLLTPFIDAGKAVFHIEYELDPSQFCSQANDMNFNSVKKNWGLDGYREACR